MTACALGMASARVLARVSDACECPRASGGFTALQRARSGGVHRTGAPVLRGSLEAGTFEDAFFAAPAPGETDRLLTACRRARDAGRRLAREARAGTRLLSATERRLVALTAGAVRVFEEICTLARLNRGRVFPSYDWLAEATCLGRATIELPPSEWSIDYDSLDQGRDEECLRRSTSRRRSSASCVRWRSCWAKAARPPKRAGGSRSASRPTIAGARNMVA